MLKISRRSGRNKVQAGVSAKITLAVFALPGLTAAQGLSNIAKPQVGETLVVTGAASSVGSIVGQLAKADGLRVIGVVGSDEKSESNYALGFWIHKQANCSRGLF